MLACMKHHSKIAIRLIEVGAKLDILSKVWNIKIWCMYKVNASTCENVMAVHYTGDLIPGSRPAHAK